MPVRMPLTIAYLGDGSSPHVTRLAQDMAARGHRVHILTEDRLCPEGTHAPEGVELHRFRFAQRFPFRVAEAKRLLERIRPDVLHSHYVNVGGFTAAATLFHPHVMMAWGSDILITAHTSRAQYWKTAAALRSADYVLSPSHSLRESIEAIAGRLRHNEVIQWGVDTRLFAPNEDPSTVKAGLGLTGRVVYSARALQPLYNQDVLVEAWPAIKAAVPDARLLLKRLAPDPAFESGLRQRIATLGFEQDVVWLEPTPFETLPSYYQAADVVVSTPSSDGTPITVLEALGCGAPVVACDLPSLREWVREDEAGRLVNPRAPEQVAKAVTALLELPEEARRLAARKKHARVADNAGKARNLARFEAIYAHVSGPRKGFPTLSNLARGGGR